MEQFTLKELEAKSDDIPDGWDPAWDRECNANIVYAYTGD